MPLRSATDAARLEMGDNGPVSEGTIRQEVRGLLRAVVTFVRSAEPREPVPQRAIRADSVLAAVALVVGLVATDMTHRGLGPAEVLAALIASVPLAARRLFPLTAFLVLLMGVLVAKRYATDLPFLTMVIAAYSAATHSRYRGRALLCLPLAGAVVAFVFWSGTPAMGGAVTAFPQHFGPVAKDRFVPGPLGGFVPAGSRWRLDGVLALLAFIGIAIVAAVAHARERIRHMQAGHEAATRRAIEAERARIAGELHDVVTHNVSVMIVQAGAARQVLAAAPGDARAALLAVESSGRAAMSELRHLLGLLNPQQAANPETADAPAAEPDLRPQPSLGQLVGLIGRMRTAGLPVDLHVGDLPADLPPGLDLAAFRVVQEALTNVLKHAGKPATRVLVDYRDGSLLLDIADSGRLIPAVGPVAVPGSGRGLTGLRERVGVYDGELDAGPQPGGGWRVRARIPVEAPIPGKLSDAGWSPPATTAGSPVLGPGAGGLPTPAAGR